MAPRAYLHPYAPPARTEFRTIVRGEGACVFDSDGKRLIDGIGSLWYCQVGHGRDEIVDAIEKQMRELATYNTFDTWANEPSELLAERIAQVAPQENPRVVLTTSGSESVDSAIKIARIAQNWRGHPEKQLVVSRSGGYHGVTYGGLSAQGLPANQEGFGPLVPGFVNMDRNDLEGTAKLFAERGNEIAAVITEPVQGAGGVHPPEPGYLEGLRRLCDDHDAYLIVDEVICGFGRLGQWFGSQYYGVTADMMTFAKGVSSGYLPLGGVVIGRSVADVLESDPERKLLHGHTYAGHPASAAAGLANLDIMEREGLVERAKQVGDWLRSGLQSLADDGVIAGVRGEGAILAAIVNEDTDAIAARDKMLDHGVIARGITDCIAFCPPLVISEAEVGQMVDAVAASV